MSFRRDRPTLLLATAAAALAACSGGGGGGGMTGPATGGNVTEVRATNALQFEPPAVTVAPGTTIRWRNTASVAHTVTPDGHQEWQRRDLVTNGQTFEHTFTTAGTYPYHCEIHPGMTGTIVVQAGATGTGQNPAGPPSGSPEDPYGD